MLKKSLLIAVLLSLALLTACNSTGPFEVSGRLLNASDNQALDHGRIVLCPMNEEGNSCTMSVGLTSSVADYEDGLFHFDNVMKGSFAIFYAADDSLNPIWDLRVIHFDTAEQIVREGFVFGTAWDSQFDDSIPAQLQITPPMALRLMSSLEVNTLSTCAISMSFEQFEGYRLYSSMSGYIHAPDMQLTAILMDGAPLTVQIDGDTNFDLAIWDTTQECGDLSLENFNPLQTEQAQ